MSSSVGGSMVGLLALGIPSIAATAIMLSAFAMHNITGGPRFIADQNEIVHTIIAGSIVQAVLLVLVGLLFIVSIARAPLAWLLPPIVICTVLGSYALSSSLNGPATLVVFSILGVAMKLRLFSGRNGDRPDDGGQPCPHMAAGRGQRPSDGGAADFDHHHHAYPCRGRSVPVSCPPQARRSGGGCLNRGHPENMA